MPDRSHDPLGCHVERNTEIENSMHQGVVLDSDDFDDLNPKTCLEGRRYAIRTLGQKRSRPQSTFAFVKTTKPGDVLGPGTGQHTSSRLRQVLDYAWLITRA
jgi:hypothetical protein